MEECKGWEILFKQEHLYPVPFQLLAGQQKLMYQLSAEGLGRVELREKGEF